MRPAELREMTNEELSGQLTRAAENLFGLKFKRQTAQATDTAELRKARREVARIRTAIREREIGIRQAPKRLTSSGTNPDGATEE